MRLQFSTSKLYGRDREVAGLQRAYQEVLEDHRSRFVLLDGYSGNGKTALVAHVGDWIRENNPKARIITGKFDEQHPKPYAGFAQAFGELVSQLMHNHDVDAENIQAMHALVEHSRVLKEIIPEIYELLGEDDHGQLRNSRGRTSVFTASCTETKGLSRRHLATSTALEKSASSRINQFRFRFTSFVRAICQTQPMLLFLDDLQWADAASLELLKALCTDEESKNLMIIGAYRGQEIDESHRLSWCIFNLKTSTVLEGRLFEMLLTDLELTDLNQFIADSLELSPERTDSLSKVIMRKTHGNIFYSIQFLKHLVEAKLINYDMNRFHWTWDLQEVAGATDLSENVIDMVSGRISQLPKKVIQILKIASCLWYSFEADVLEHVVVSVQKGSKNWRDKLSLAGNESCRSLTIDSKDFDGIEKALLLAVEEGLLDPMGSHGYKFSHDKIREAAYSLIKEGEELEELQVVLGEILWVMYNSQGGQQWMLFSAVDMLNKVVHHFTSPTLQLELADVNLEAAHQALEVSAFLPAIGYLRAGIDLLGADSWNIHYELSLSLHSELAFLESSVGHFEKSEELVNETLVHAAAFEDKVSVYTTQIRSLGVQGKHSEALKLGYEVLWGLGETFPIAKKGLLFRMNVKADTVATRSLLKKYTNDDILSLPRIKKLKKQQALVILNQMTDAAFHLGKVHQLYLIINRMVRISLQDGLGDVSGVVFAMYGMSLHPSNGDRRESFRFGQLALKLQEEVGAKQWLCRVMVYVYVLLNHWQAPLQNSCDPLLTAYSSGMETGDMDYAFKSAGSFFTLHWYIGKDIKSGVIEMRKFCAKMREYKQEKTLSIYLPIFQCMLNMTGAVKNPLALCGEAISKEEYEEKKMKNKMIMTYQMQLAYYFNDLWLADTLSTSLQEMVTSFEANYTYVATRFFFGLIALRVATTGSGLRRQKNIALAQEVMDEMESWTKYGGVNCLSKYLILKAKWKALKCYDSSSRGCMQLMSAKETIDNVRQAFDAAISTSLRSGFINDAALACELACRFYERVNDIEWAATYKTRAIAYYGQWGALAKVEHLKSNNSQGFVLATPSLGMRETNASGAMAGQKLFRNSVLQNHAKVRVSHNMTASANSERTDRTSRFEDGALFTAAAAFGGGPLSSELFTTTSTLPMPQEGDPEEKKVG